MRQILLKGNRLFIRVDRSYVRQNAEFTARFIGHADFKQNLRLKEMHRMSNKKAISLQSLDS